MFEDAVLDEAVFSSMIEGAFTTREAAAGLIRRQKAPANKSEQMVKNNYDALTYVLSHLDERITEGTFWPSHAL
jgi:Fic family protein